MDPEAREPGGAPSNAVGLDLGHTATALRIGVLALQGDFARHRSALERCGVVAVEVRKPEELADLDGLIVPGGESTTLLKLLDAGRFIPAFERFHAEDRPLFGTCAGLILLARDVTNPTQPSLGMIDVGVERNAYGRQRESFEGTAVVELDLRRTTVEMIFIRAPRIRRVGPGVRTLAEHRGEPVLAQEGSVLVAAFHPELTQDLTVHRYFGDLARSARARRRDGTTTR